MTFHHVKWAFPKCPTKSILQIGGESWLHRMGGYGKREYLTSDRDISGKWDCIVVPEMEVTPYMVDHLNIGGMIMFQNGIIKSSLNMVCIHCDKFLIYKKKA